MTIMTALNVRDTQRRFYGTLRLPPAFPYPILECGHPVVTGDRRSFRKGSDKVRQEAVGNLVPRKGYVNVRPRPSGAEGLARRSADAARPKAECPRDVHKSLVKAHKWIFAINLDMLVYVPPPAGLEEFEKQLGILLWLGNAAKT